MPRHPPCALTNLATKMLASTVQFSKYGQAALTTHRSTHHHTPHNHGARPRAVRSDDDPPQPSPKGHPHTVSAYSLRTQQCAAHQPNRAGRNMSAFHPKMSNHPRQHLRGWLSMLLRKEVIQPHLPVRLPCYDFVPIASPTFDGSLPQGVRPPASGVTDFRDVTGGVYKARERIHRSIADLRLLATPTSRGRVADPDPN
jgi:hypothetical protein